MNKSTMQAKVVNMVETVAAKHHYMITKKICLLFGG